MAEGVDRATAEREAGRALQAASEQIALALRESQPQVEALGEALGQLAATLASGVEDRAQLDQLRQQMQRAVMRLQFYDRMTQHLTHVQDYLSRSASKLVAAAGESDAGWTGVHQQLSDRLLSDTQRLQLGRAFREKLEARSGAQPRESGAALPGDIDLF